MTPKDPLAKEVRDTIEEYAEWRSMNEAGVDMDLEAKLEEATQQLLSLCRRERIEQVDRFEVIDETGRAYARGSIYGRPVKIELSYQDGGKTLKVFVQDRKGGKIDAVLLGA